MRYLSSISLALIVLMALACSSEPTATPTPPGPMLTEREAIAVLKNYLGQKNINRGQVQCLAYYTKLNASWSARYDGDGVWKVRADISESESKLRSEMPGMWDVFEKTKSVVTTTGYKC